MTNPDPKRTVQFTTPLQREGCTHVVVYRGRGFLFASYDDAASFKDFVVRWLDALERAGGDVAVVPLAIVGNEKITP